MSVLRVLGWAVTLVFPFALWLGYGHVSVRWLALLPLAALILRGDLARFGKAGWFLVAGSAVIVGATLLTGARAPLLAYPVLVSFALFLVFALSLWRPPTVIERIARLSEPELGPRGVAYTRRVTIAWCIFFVCNGLVSALTAAFASPSIWAFYNGMLSYVLIGLMFAIEWLIRQRVRHAHTVS